MEFVQFQQMLLATTSAEDAPRTQAEAMLKQMLDDQPDTLSTMLIQAATQGQTFEIKHTACVLFRRYLYYMAEPEKSLWQTSNPQIKAQIKQHLLNALTTEPEARLRKSLKDVVIVLASNIQIEFVELTDEEKTAAGGHFWPELLQSLWACAQSEAPDLREIALLILSEVPRVFEAQVERYLAPLMQLLQTSLANAEFITVQVAGVKALTGFITYGLDVKEHRAYLAPLLPLVIQVIVGALQASDEVQAQDALESLIELAELRPKFFRQSMPVVIENLTNIAQADQLEDGTRRLAVEVLLELCQQADGMVRKFPDVANKLVPLFLNMCTEYEDDPEWSKLDDDDMGDEDSNCTFGEQSLDRLALALSGTAVIPVIFQYLPGMLQDEKWQSRAAALTAIAAVAEGCIEQMRPTLADVMAQVTPKLLDPHPRVRYTACNAVGQLSIDFAAPAGKERKMGFQTMFHETVVPALLNMMQDVENPRVQAHGAAALVNFCEHAHKSTLQPHLNNILERLAEMLSSSFRIVLEQTVTALATVADTSKDLFGQYYQHFMPQLKMILMTPPRDPKWRLLRGKTMECITLIGIAVKKEVFAPDAREVMEALNTTQQTAEQDPDDPQISYMLAAWARICEILGDDFQPYLGIVMPPLLHSIQLEPEVQVLEANQNPGDLAGGAENWEIIPAGEDRNIGIKTSILDEKKTACEMLRIYIQQMKGSFAPYIEQVAPIVLNLLKFVLDEDIRSTAASIIPLLLHSALAAGQGPQCAALWQGFSQELLLAIQNETEVEVISWQIESLKDCIETICGQGGPEYVTPEVLAGIVALLDTYMQDYSVRCDDRKARRTTDEDYDVESEKHINMEEEDEVQAIKEIANLIHTLFSSLGPAFVQPFVGLMPEFAKMLDPQGRPHSDHQWALCIIDDLVETCGPESFPLVAPYVQYILGYLVDNPDDSHPEVIQAAAYGIGIMAMTGGAPFCEVCKQALPLLQALVQAPDARALGKIDATENALSAIVKICKQPEMGFPLAETLPQILAWLPITNDDEEAHFVYSYLCELLQANDPVIMTEANLIRTFDIFAMVVNTYVAPIDEDDGVGITILQTVKAIGAANPSVMEQIVGRISDVDNRQKLVGLLNAAQ